MALTILVTSSPATLSGEKLITQLTVLCQKQQVIQIFFLAEGLLQTLDNHVIAYLSQLNTTAQQNQPSIALGYCPSSAARHIPNYQSDIIEDYGLTQFYALLHNSAQLEQI
jgi:hypothetical protein